jgi:hypothetical protein
MLNPSMSDLIGGSVRKRIFTGILTASQDKTIWQSVKEVHRIEESMPFSLESECPSSDVCFVSLELVWD